MDSVGAGTFGKPLLVELSHLIEQFALAAEPGVPTVVIAMFQRLAYFSREAQVYREIAARGAVIVVGMAENASRSSRRAYGTCSSRPRTTWSACGASPR